MRKETTAFLSGLLEAERLKGIGKYYAKEVTLDYGKTEIIDDNRVPAEKCVKSKTRRIDYLQFVPKNQLSVDGIEKGLFVCYEIKSCKADFLSGYGQNFVGEKNYLVMSMETYKQLNECGEIDRLPRKIGILVPIPRSKKYDDTRIADEYNDPTPITDDYSKWYFETVRVSKTAVREKSIIELLFCMVRSNQ